MKRRDFITLLGAMVGVSACTGAFAAKTSRTARIGVLLEFLPAQEGLEDLLRGPLAALGWREGENLQIEQRVAGNLANLPRFATELVALRPDVLIGVGSTESKALQAATRDIPIVFANSSDPVGAGLVDSIARPGRNATGIAWAPRLLWSKRLGLVVELLGHQPAKVAWLTNPEEVVHRANEEAILQSAEPMGIEVERLYVREPSDFDRVFAATVGSEALLVKVTDLTLVLRWQIAEQALRHQLPTIFETRDFVEAGGLISYGGNLRDNWRRAASLVDKILRGSRPGDLPVEQGSRFDLVINLKTAKTLGLTIPLSLLATADEVIE
jgi:putative tryptophan/tyrosine transport system substrate-binding protein